MAKCLDFLVEKKLIKKREGFFSAMPPQNAPFGICAWIMNE
jgi:hypothetical protein